MKTPRSRRILLEDDSLSDYDRAKKAIRISKKQGRQIPPSVSEGLRIALDKYREPK
jgi:hypothetical protein